FSPADCRTCPSLRDCVSSPKAQRREITLRPRDEYEALHQARQLQATDEWKDRYKIRAGVEGTISQGVQACGLRRSRYRGLAKTSLQHQLTGAAINLIRINAWLSDKPRARTRTSPLAALRPAA
ncbi:transposase, partial [Streptomyces sp. NPDC001544]|uniref:transposase n=1 Tax=Streptomyces sp. NPDC001544 TaxID=3364584 RepID=UPI0036CF8645